MSQFGPFECTVGEKTEGTMCSDISLPAIRELCPHIFEVSVTHVVNAEDIDVWVVWYAFLNIRIKTKC